MSQQRHVSAASGEPQYVLSVRGASQDRDICLPVQGHPMAPVAPAAAPPGNFGPVPTGGHNLIHSLLRGRYHWAIFWAILLGASLGFYGWRHTRLIYRSTGLIRIVPNPQPIMYKTSATEQNFDGFIDTQVTLMKSQAVIERAMHSEPWRNLGRGSTDAEIDSFTDRLSIERSSRGELVTLAFTDRDIEASMVAVKAVIESYMELYGGEDANTDKQTLRVLEERQATLDADLKAVRNQIMTIAQEFGSDSLSQQFQFELAELQKLESILRDTQLKVAAAEAAANAEKRSLPQGKLEAEDIALNDSLMRDYLKDRAEWEGRLEVLQQRYGDNHRNVQEAKVILDALNRRINDYVARYATGRGAGGAQPLTPAGLELIRDQEKRYAVLYEEARTRLMNMGRKHLQIESLRAQMETVRQQFAETTTRIEQLKLESQAKGRITVVSDCERPLGPYVDGRRKNAALGAMGGATLGVMMVLAIGLLDRRRFRSPEDTHSAVGPLRLLGILPTLPPDLSDPEQAALAAQCVHQVRTEMQIHGGPNQAFAVTSSMAGSGKTSLTLALGLSFASSGARTLLIDCDLAGGGLTSRLEGILRRRIGQILTRDARVTPERLEKALKLARGSRRRLGEVLVELGYASADQVKAALVQQKERSHGLLDVLAGGNLRDAVIDSGTPNLWLLPLGGAGARHISALSPASIRRLLDAARPQYDTVLIDTGPCPGSLESLLVCTQADGVVMVVSRGEHRPIAEKSFQHLIDIGARVMGLVFNRAEHRDMVRYGTTSRTVSSPATAESRAPSTLDPERASRFGPMAAAVATDNSAHPFK